MNSRLYTGRVTHRRTTPAVNQFSYGVYYVHVDLAELDELDSGLKRFGHNRRALVSLWDVDHGPRDGAPLRPWIEGVLAQAGVDLAGGRVELLSFPRVLGFKFYPVSFWYCYHADGRVRAVLAEVHNTFGDRHNYLLHNGGEPLDWHANPEAAKAFYVSPFIQRENVRYRFHFTEPGERLSVTIFDHVGAKNASGTPFEIRPEDLVTTLVPTAPEKLPPLVLTASIALTAQPLTDAALTRAVLRMGPVSLRAVVFVHWQALKLFAKRVPFFAHTPPPEQELSR